MSLRASPASVHATTRRPTGPRRRGPLPPPRRPQLPRSCALLADAARAAALETRAPATCRPRRAPTLGPCRTTRRAIACRGRTLSVVYTGNLPRGVPEVDECGLAEIGNSKEETRGTQFRQVVRALPDSTAASNRL
jgi:hypothetical protein